MTATPTAEPAPAARAADERLGGSRPIAPAAPLLPRGFVAEAVAAGFTAPCAVAAVGERLYAVEAGHPRRTPPRLFRLEPRSGAASLLAELNRSAAGAAPSLTVRDGQPLVVYAGDAWLLGEDGGLDLLQAPTPGDAPLAGLLRGSWLAADGGWYVADPGPRNALGEYTPGAGIIWRIRAADPLRPEGATPRRWTLEHGRELVATRPRPAIALGVAAVALALALYYRARRGRTAAGVTVTAR